MSFLKKIAASTGEYCHVYKANAGVDNTQRKTDTEIQNEIKSIAKSADMSVEVTTHWTGSVSYPIGVLYYGDIKIGFLEQQTSDLWKIKLANEFESKVKNELKDLVAGLHAHQYTSRYSVIYNVTKPELLSYLKRIKDKLVSSIGHKKPFKLHIGERPTHYVTPKLKREQQKSLLKLVKSKYQIYYR